MWLGHGALYVLRVETPYRLIRMNVTNLRICLCGYARNSNFNLARPRHYSWLHLQYATTPSTCLLRVACSQLFSARMAGPVRQGIDQASLDRYIEKNTTEIKTPLDLKQVRPVYMLPTTSVQHKHSSVSARVILHTWSPTALKSDMSYGRSHLEDCFRRQPIRSTASTE